MKKSTGIMCIMRKIICFDDRLRTWFGWKPKKGTEFWRKHTLLHWTCAYFHQLKPIFSAAICRSNRIPIQTKRDKWSAFYMSNPIILCMISWWIADTLTQCTHTNRFISLICKLIFIHNFFFSMRIFNCSRPLEYKTTQTTANNHTHIFLAVPHFF